MKKIFLIRHGETEHNRDDAIAGQMDISLNEYGNKQAEKLAERLSSKEFAAAYSSDLERTYETVRTVAKKHDLHPDRYEEFRERGFGKYEGRSKDDWRKVVRNHDGERHHLSPEEGESLKEVGERFVGKLEDLMEAHSDGDKIVVGGHGVAIKATIMEVLELKGDGYNKLEQDNTAITELEYRRGNWKIIRMNDTAHLE